MYGRLMIGLNGIFLNNKHVKVINYRLNSIFALP